VSQDDKLDLDLIAMVQRARMQHDAEAQPSQISAIFNEAASCSIGSLEKNRVCANGRRSICALIASRTMM